MEPDIDFKELSSRMRKGLGRVRRLRTTVRILIILIFAGALVWYAFLFFGVSHYEIDYRFILGFFAVFCVAYYAFIPCFNALNKWEIRIMSDIISKLFPEARFSPAGSIPSKVIASSRLFSTQTTTGPSVSSTCYGRLDIPVGGQWMSIVDAGIMSASRKDLSSMNFLETLYNSLIRPVFKARLESNIYSFRGMFGCCKVERKFKGYVMLLPDNLENKIGYLAQTVQGFKQKFGARFVHMEDPEFESLFAVYADDEVEARMVLTPVMMRRMTRLRRTFNRDLMFSFNGDTLYFASDTPDGFLRPGRKSLNDVQLLEQLYREIDFCRNVRIEMR